MSGTKALGEVLSRYVNSVQFHEATHAAARAELDALKRRVKALEGLRLALAQVAAGGEVRELPSVVQAAWALFVETES